MSTRKIAEYINHDLGKRAAVRKDSEWLEYIVVFFVMQGNGWQRLNGADYYAGGCSDECLSDAIYTAKHHCGQL